MKTVRPFYACSILIPAVLIFTLTALPTAATLAATPPPLVTPDLQLSATVDNNDPPAFGYFSVTFTLENTGDADADNIVVNIPGPTAGEAVIQGSDPYTASQGSYNTWSTFDWTVGSLPANTTATITINYFNLSENEKYIYGQVSSQTPADADSSPGNGAPPTVNEDDETVVWVNGPGNDPCTFWNAADTEVLCVNENDMDNYDVYLLTTSGNNEYVNKHEVAPTGELLSSSLVGLLASDSVLIQGNQLIKKLAGGVIEWEKTIPQSVLDDYPALTHATELNDGSIILGGVEKHYSPAWPPFDSDSLYLVKLNANMVFLDAVTVFAKANANSPTYIGGDILYQLLPRLDGGVDVIYTVGNPFNFIQGQPEFYIKGYDNDLQLLDTYTSLSNFMPERMIQTPCGQYLLQGTDEFVSQGSNFEGEVKRWINLPDKAIHQSLVNGSGGIDNFGAYNTYQFVGINSNGVVQLGYSQIQSVFTVSTVNLIFDPFGTSISMPVPYFPFDYVINTGQNEALIFYQEGGSLQITLASCIELDPCDLTIETSNFQCEDNNTPNDPSDDTWSFDLTVFNSGAGNQWKFLSGSPSFGGMEYGIPITIDEISPNNSPTYFIRDAVLENCELILSVASPAGCGSDPGTCVNNMLENPGFENSNTALAPWTVDGIAPVTISNDAYSGNNAALITGQDYTKLIQEVPVAPGDELTFSAQIKAVTNNFLLRLRFLNANGNVLSTFQESEPATGQYVENTVSATAPANAASVLATLLKTGSTGDVLADDFCLTGSVVDPCNPDLTPPVIENCPTDISITTSANGEMVFWTPPTASDACSTASLSGNYAPGDFFPLGTTTVEYTAEDLSGNVSVCSFNITVSPDDPGTCVNNMLENPGFENNNTTLDPWTVDGIAPVTISSDAYSGNNAALISGQDYTKLIQEVPVAPGDELTFSAQIKAVTNNFLLRLRFLNANGNVLSTFQESEPATGQYVENTVSAIAPANAASVLATLLKTGSTGDVLADDFCLTGSVVDPCNPDLTPPVIENCPTDISITTSANGEMVFWTPPTASDACSTASLSGNYAPGDFFPLGTTTVEYTAEDLSGNVSVCSFNITVSPDDPGTCVNNMLENPGFENNNTTLDPWTVDGIAPVTISSDAYSGNNAALISGQDYTKLIQEVPVAPGDELTFSAQIKAVTNNFLLRLRFLNANGNVLSTFQESEPATGQYVENTVSAIAPANAASVLATLLKTGSTGDVLADEFCLTGGSNPGLPDLIVSDLTAPGVAEVRRVYTIPYELFNADAGSTPQTYYFSAYLSADPSFSNDDLLLNTLTHDELGVSVIIPGDMDIFIPDGTTPGTYYLLFIVDNFNMVTESDESNNVFSQPLTLEENTGLPCDIYDGQHGSFHCSEYFPNGNLKLVTISSLNAFEHEIDAGGNIIATNHIGEEPGLARPRYYIDNGELVKFTYPGFVEWTKPLPNDLVTAYDTIEQIIAFDGGFVFAGYQFEGANYPNEADRGLRLVKTDFDLNILHTADFVTPGSTFAFVHDLETVFADRFFIIYNQGTNFLGSNEAVLMVMDTQLGVQSSEVISSLSGAVSVLDEIDLHVTKCGHWLMTTMGGSSGGGGGFLNTNSVTNGAYLFSNDQFIPFKTYTTTHTNSGFGGAIQYTNSVAFTGPASDGTTLTANETHSYSNSFPPFAYIPAQDTLYLEHSDGNNLLWSAQKVPFGQYPFRELVEIGGNYYLVRYGIGLTDADCDNNDPTGSGDPVDCAAASDFPWHEWISRVSLSNLDHPSGKTAYSDFTNLTPAGLMAGQSFPIEIDVTFSYNAHDPYFSVFIDFDGDGLFESNEVLTGHLTNLASGSSITHTWSGQVNVPPNALPGTHSMRVVLQRGSHATSACGTIPFGEVEDYLINIPASAPSPLKAPEETNKLRLWPNPAQQHVYVDVEEFLSMPVSLDIVNNLGQSVYQESIQTVRNKILTIDLDGWKNGHYTVWLKPQYGPRRVAQLVIVRTY